MKEPQYSPHKRLTLVYAFALSVVAIMVIVSYFLMSEYLITDPDNPEDERSHIGRMINLNGRCATFSQEIQNYALRIQFNPSLDSARKSFEALELKLAEFEKTYEGLKNGDKDFKLNPRFNTAEIKKRFLEIDKNFYSILQATKSLIATKEIAETAQAKAQMNEATETVLQNADIFSRKMLDLNFDYDQEAANTIAYWGKVEFWMMFATLLVLVLEVVFIFRPAVQTIKDYFSELKKGNQELREANEQIKKNEEQLRFTAENLAKTNADLVVSQAELQESNSLKDKFFSIVVHDLKSPLNSLKGITNLLCNFTDKITYEEIRQTAKDLDKSIDGVFEFIDNLLTWAKLQMEYIHFQPKVFHLKNLMNAQMPLFRLQAKSKTIVLKYMVNSDIQVFADENYTNIVLRNLVSNALKFTKEGGEVIVSAKLRNGFVEVSVADSGVGIASENLKNLFKIDKQVSSAGTSGEKGTGLGLILSKEFIEKNGGVLNVISEQGKGSVFSFTVPVAVFND